jgi:urease accessory protein
MKSKFAQQSKLYLRVEEKNNRTCLVDNFSTPPLKVMRPFYRSDQGMELMIMSASAGILAGDDQLIDIGIGANTNVEISSQSFEKIFTMKPDELAVRNTTIQVGPNASLIYNPLTTIPFRGSSYRAKTSIQLENETSRFIMMDIINSGRVDSGESFQFRKFQSVTEIISQGEYLYLDNCHFEPEQSQMADFGMFEGFTHLLTVLIFHHQLAEEKKAEIRKIIDSHPSVQGGISTTWSGNYVVRVLGGNSQELEKIAKKVTEQCQ